eukprot:3660433-Rhodomonas_salina.1
METVGYRQVEMACSLCPSNSDVAWDSYSTRNASVWPFVVFPAACVFLSYASCQPQQHMNPITKFKLHRGPARSAARGSTQSAKNIV